MQGESNECYIILSALLCAAPSCAVIHREEVASAFEKCILLKNLKFAIHLLSTYVSWRKYLQNFV